jgi:hypothetical protein
MLQMIAERRLDPGALLGSTIDLRTAASNFATQAGFEGAGVHVIDTFA